MAVAQNAIVTNQKQHSRSNPPITIALTSIRPTPSAAGAPRYRAPGCAERSSTIAGDRNVISQRLHNAQIDPDSNAGPYPNLDPDLGGWARVSGGSGGAYICACLREGERERERECVCVCVCDDGV